MQVVSRRMLIMVLADIIGIVALLAIRQEARAELAFVNYWLVPLTVLFGVLTAAAAAYLIFSIVKKLDTSTHAVTPAMLFCIAAFCLIACLLYKRVMAMTLIVASITATVLFLVYCLYVHIFYR